MENRIKPSKLIEGAISILELSGGSPIKKNGKITFKTKPTWGHPWRFIKHDPRMNCTLWKTFMYQAICEKQLPENQWFIPTGCQDCYKVVVRPNTYTALLAAEWLMEKLDHFGKCGCEKRKTVKGLYGVYFYCRTLPEGLKRLSEIRHYYPSAILKRACTEMELKHGPSDKWIVTDYQLEIEKEVNHRIFFDSNQLPQAQEDIDRVHEFWRKFAWKLDPTYGGEAEYPMPTTYGG